VAEERAHSSLAAIREACFERFAGGRLGVANGLRRDGTPLDPNGTHPLEVWTGINFGLAAYYRLMGDTDTALRICGAVVEQVYGGGLQFRTPEAITAVGTFRACHYLRAKFQGKPEHVVNYFFFVAEELRELMAKLGVRHLDDLIGRSDLLDMRAGIEHWKATGLDFSRIFYQPRVPQDVPRRVVTTQDHGLEGALDHRLMELARPSLERAERTSFMTEIRNVHRTAGTMLSGEVARRYGHAGLPDDTIHIQLNGTAGQSFCAFLARGVTMDLIGQAND